MRASDRTYRALLDEIQSGALAPGTALAEADLAARLGVSRTPVREALGRLAADGLVIEVSPRLTVVADLAADDIRALFELRRALEETAVRIAATRGDAAAFAALATAFERTDAATGAEHAGTRIDVAAYYALIADFDAQVDAAASNAYLASALRTVRTHLVRVRRLASDKPERLAASVAEHRLIAQAIATRDADLAAHATHVHLHNALESILATSASTREGAP
jgi:DNA-binding GntR family transcriptional regulator